MPLRSSIAWMTFLLLALLAGSGRAAGFVDAAERYVVLPDRIGRVMTANPAADVLVFVLAPEKLLGWSVPLSRGQGTTGPEKILRVADYRRSSAPEPGGDRPSGRPTAPRPDHRGGPGLAGSCGARRTNPATDRGPVPPP